MGIQMTMMGYALLTSLLFCQHGRPAPLNQLSDTVSVLQSDRKQAAVAPIQFSGNVDILLPTQYRKESTGYPQNVHEKEWFEIYKDIKTGRWKIEKADLKITYGRDECVGEDIMIIQSDRVNAEIFFTYFEGLAEGEPITLLENRPLYPERNVVFDFNGTTYQFFPIGTCLDESGQMMSAADVKAMNEEDLIDNVTIAGYRLSYGELGNNEEIAVIDHIEFSTPQVIWAGDVNNDGLPDLILDLPDFYESRHLFFFLSDNDDQEKPLKKVAELRVVNDC